MPDALRQLLLSGFPFIDVRAPVEAAQGSIPSALNLPILTDEERAEVGVCHRANGADAANALGHKLVSGDVKAARVGQWVHHVNTHPQTHLFCARGGRRSQIACEWLQDAGVSVTRVDGGYKRIRSLLMNELTLDAQALTLLGGSTGVGKTDFLIQDPVHIDLEGLANHRGSAFGSAAKPQPSQASFENALAVALMKWKAAPARLLLEDEGRLIGRVHLPQPIQEAMKAAPIVILEAPFEARVERILNDYVVEQSQDFNRVFGDQGFDAYKTYLTEALSKIKKRLGGEQYQICRKLMDTALAAQLCGNSELHSAWIVHLLKHYYDPMYDYQLSLKTERIVFRGDSTGCRDYLQHSRTG